MWQFVKGDYRVVPGFDVRYHRLKWPSSAINKSTATTARNYWNFESDFNIFSLFKCDHLVNENISPLVKKR